MIALDPGLPCYGVRESGGGKDPVHRILILAHR